MSFLSSFAQKTILDSGHRWNGYAQILCAFLFCFLWQNWRGTRHMNAVILPTKEWKKKELKKSTPSMQGKDEKTIRTRKTLKTEKHLFMFNNINIHTKSVDDIEHAIMIYPSPHQKCKDLKKKHVCRNWKNILLGLGRNHFRIKTSIFCQRLVRI